MIIDCISDLHGFYPDLEGGDLLIIAGDLTATDTEKQYDDFWRWLCYQEYKKKVVIAGNHDAYLQFNPDFFDLCKDIDYLCDSGTEFQGLKIWGSPWTKTFQGMNPKCKAFTCDTEDELDEKWRLIPKDVDILITHSPPFLILDKTCDGKNVGSTYLMDHYLRRPKPQLWVMGHIHEAYGKEGSCSKWGDSVYVNASHVNEHYQPVNKPIRIIL